MEMDALINVGLTAAIGGLGWWLKSQHDELGRVRILLNRTREELAKEYVSKVENNTVMDRVMDRFDRLEEKIDRLMER
jgi:Tfp pilus assembly protein PilO|tara:strand:- start:231 stop:464 length:234 start_codon:yes stop_codon:yes gene_type:complete